MKNKLYRMQYIYSYYWEAFVPKNGRHGNYFLRGRNSRFSKTLYKKGEELPF